MKNKFKAFTLIELLIVISIIGLLATTMVIAINPSKQLAKARDGQREGDVYSIFSYVQQYKSEHNGTLPDTDGDPETNNFPTSLTCIGSSGGCFNLAGAGDDDESIVPDYAAALPTDPKTGSGVNTGYLIMVDAYGHITASASGETKTISITR
ncbi:MAG TPA: type II secretion system protein [Patescibacteria group bacterium]|nr:type II secretion system protein [Patescibacteria group bacterium]